MAEPTTCGTCRGVGEVGPFDGAMRVCSTCDGEGEYVEYRFPPKVVTVADLQAFLPWAAIEPNNEGELVIYTGLQHINEDGDDYDSTPLAFTEGMEG